jgi:hypothetical protein
LLSLTNAQDPPRKKNKKIPEPQKIVVDTLTKSERKADTTLMKLREEQIKLDSLLKEKSKK